MADWLSSWQVITRLIRRVQIAVSSEFLCVLSGEFGHFSSKDKMLKSTLKGAMLPWFCCFGSIFRLNRYLVVLLKHKIFLINCEVNIKWMFKNWHSDQWQIELPEPARAEDLDNSSPFVWFCHWALLKYCGRYARRKMQHKSSLLLLQKLMDRHTR